MRRSPSLLSLKAMTPAQWALRVPGVLALCAVVALAAGSRNGHPMTTQIRALADDVVTPMISVLSAPAQGIRSASNWLSEWVDVHGENAVLKAQLQETSQLRAEAATLKAENEALRALAHVVPEGAKSYTATRIVGDVGGAYVRSALVSGGTQDGIAIGQAVIGPDGLAGRVVEAGKTSARVLLLTDINSRVPVISERSRERSIAAGNNTQLLSLSYITSGSKLTVGERLLTSGDGGVFPPGIPVGVVQDIQGSEVTVQPLTDWTHLEFVNSVAYDF